MKFAAVLRDSAVDLPDAEDLFRKYKQLKKSLKRIPAAAHANVDVSSDDQGSPGPSRRDAQPQPPEQHARSVLAHPISRSREQEQPGSGGGDSNEDADAAQPLEDIAAVEAGADGADGGVDAGLEAAFSRALTADVMELNERYIEKEEDYVITFGNLEEQVAAAHDANAKAEAYRAFVNFHGELLMLLHWSILAYTGLVKILKKHRKRTGTLLHAPHLEHLLAQPFCSVEVTIDMVRQAEVHVASLAKDLNISAPPPAALPDGVATSANDLMRGHVPSPPPLQHQEQEQAEQPGSSLRSMGVGHATIYKNRKHGNSNNNNNNNDINEVVGVVNAGSHLRGASETMTSPSGHIDRKESTAMTSPKHNKKGNDDHPYPRGNNPRHGNARGALGGQKRAASMEVLTEHHPQQAQQGSDSANNDRAVHGACKHVPAPVSVPPQDHNDKNTEHKKRKVVAIDDDIAGRNRGAVESGAGSQDPSQGNLQDRYQQEQQQQHQQQQQQQVLPPEAEAASRRVRAALDVWQKLQSNASTPSTVIAVGGIGMVPGQQPAAAAAANLSKGSAVE